MKLCHNTDIMFTEARPCPVAEAKASHLISDLSYSSCSVLPDQVACERGHLHGSVLNRELIVGDVVSSVFYAVATSESIPDSLRSRSLRLELNHHVLHPQHAEPVSGLERVQLAYHAGRQAAKVLRGDDTRQGHAAFSSSRRPSFYVVLRGLKSADLYPCSFCTFFEYKSHIFEDLHIPRPTCVHPGTVSESFYSKTEARAYCIGAGLSDIVLPKKDDRGSKRKRSSKIIGSKGKSSTAVRFPGGHVFMKAVREEFATATAVGEKFFECSRTNKMFSKMHEGDLLLLVQTRSQSRVVAVGEVSCTVSREDNRGVLYHLLPHRLHASLNVYLKGAASFDYVQFSKVYDLRDMNLKVQDVLGYGDFSMDMRKNFGMGVLDAVATSGSSIEKLREFLQNQSTRWAKPSGHGIEPLSGVIDSLMSTWKIPAMMSVERDNVDCEGDKLVQQAYVGVASAADAFTTRHFPSGQDWLVGKGRRKREDHNQREHVSSGQGCFHAPGDYKNMAPASWL